MAYKTSLQERQAAMRQRYGEVPSHEIKQAAAVYFRALSRRPMRTEDVNALLVTAGVKFSAMQQARELLEIGERVCRGESWLNMPRHIAAHPPEV